MPISNDADLSGIARFSRAMTFVLTAVLVMIPCALGLYAFAFSEHLINIPALDALDAAPGPLSLPWSFAAFAVLLGASAPLLYATNAARLMFDGFRRGDIFSPKAATRMKQIALGLLAQAFVSPLAAMALSFVLKSAGKTNSLVLSVSSNDLWIAIFALIFLGIAKVMRAAASLAEDHAAIV